MYIEDMFDNVKGKYVLVRKIKSTRIPGETAVTYLQVGQLYWAHKDYNGDIGIMEDGSTGFNVVCHKDKWTVTFGAYNLIDTDSWEIIAHR